MRRGYGVQQVDQDVGVDMRLLRVSGRADLALLVVTLPAQGMDDVSRRLDDLAPRLVAFARAGDLCEIVVVLRGPGDGAEHLSLDETPPALDRLLAGHALPLTAVIDGVGGDPVERFGARCDQQVWGRQAEGNGDAHGHRHRNRLNTPLRGPTLVDVVIRSVREQTDLRELLAENPAHSP